MYPSEKALDKAFPGKGRALRQVLTGSMSYVDGYASVSKWLAQCYNPPKSLERRQCAVNEVLEGYGTEAIWGHSVTCPVAVYVNLGDTYATTLLYNYRTDTWSITSWGDFVERVDEPWTAI